MTAQTVITAGEFRESCEVTQDSTFLRRNSKKASGKEKTKQNKAFPPQPEHSLQSQKLYFWHPAHPSASFPFIFVSKGSFVCVIRRFLLVSTTQSGRAVTSTVFKLFYNNVTTTWNELLLLHFRPARLGGFTQVHHDSVLIVFFPP